MSAFLGISKMYQPAAKAVLITALLVGSAQANTPCVVFESPTQGKAIESDICTLAVKPCESVRSIAFSAQYSSETGSVLNSVAIGNITRPPFKLIWNIKEIPNQLYEGMTVFAEATLKNGKVETYKRQGVFLTHEPVQRESYGIFYALEGKAKRGNGIQLHSSNQTAKGRVFILYDEEVFRFRIEVEDPLFYSNLPKAKLNQFVTEILIDAQNTRAPGPTRDVIMFSIPLSGKPHRVFWNSKVGADGSYNLVRTSEESPYRFSVKTQDFKGYTVDYHIPKEVFGSRTPKSFGLNVVAAALDKNNQVHKLGWIKRDHTPKAEYCPYLWNTAIVPRKPILANPFLIFLVGLVAGFLTALLVVAIVHAIMKATNSLAKFEDAEQDIKLWESIKEVLDNRVTEKVLGPEAVAEQLGLSVQKVNALVRRYANEPFRNYLMRARIEIAKERLRSSHSSHTAIAESVGFTDVEEMERYFKKIYRTTPYKFREEYQVT